MRLRFTLCFLVLRGGVAYVTLGIDGIMGTHHSSQLRGHDASHETKNYSFPGSTQEPIE
ncbi:unnamed protein product [Prunus brigantina]